MEDEQERKVSTPIYDKKFAFNEKSDIRTVKFIGNFTYFDEPEFENDFPVSKVDPENWEALPRHDANKLIDIGSHQYFVVVTEEGQIHHLVPMDLVGGLDTRDAINLQKYLLQIRDLSDLNYLEGDPMTAYKCNLGVLHQRR